MAKAAGILVGLVVGAGVVWWQISKKDSTSTEYRDVMSGLYCQVCDTEAETNYVKGLVEQHHEAAFAEAYRLGGRRRAASMDELRYAKALHDAMHAQMVLDGQTALAERCTMVYEVMVKAAETANEG